MEDDSKIRDDTFDNIFGIRSDDPDAADAAMDASSGDASSEDDGAGGAPAWGNEPEDAALDEGRPLAASSVQQTFAKAGDAAAGAARNAGAAIAEGLSALKDVASAAREHAGAKARMREMQAAFEQDSAALQHRLDIESDYTRIVSNETAELQDAGRAAHEATATIESLSAERDQLSNQLSALKAENEQMLRPYKTLVESTRKRSDDTSRILGDARRAVKDAESQVEEVTRRREQSIASANRTLDSAQERLRKVQEELKAMQDNPASALSAIFDLKGEVAQEAASVEAARADVQTATTDSQYAVDSAQQQLFTLRQSLGAAEGDYETAKKEAEDRRAEFDRLHKDATGKERALRHEIDTRVAGIEHAQGVLRGAEDRIKEAQGILDEANEIHATPEITESLMASVGQQKAELDRQRSHIQALAASEKSLRESTRGKRVLFIAVIVAAVVVLAIILWLIFGSK